MTLMYTVSKATKLNRLADALAKALEYVEWDEGGHCLWCYGWERTGGHAPDCQRQVALREYREAMDRG